jgi:hypothetical protein
MRAVPSFAIVTAILLALGSTAAADHARIYVYAQRQTAARSWLPITCDGSVVAELKQGRFFAIDVPPGRHSLGTGQGVPGFLEAAAGGESFVRLNWHYETGRPPIPVLSAIAPDRAHAEMKFLSYIDTRKALSASVSKTDPRGPPELQLKRRSEK